MNSKDLEARIEHLILINTILIKTYEIYVESITNLSFISNSALMLSIFLEDRQTDGFPTHWFISLYAMPFYNIILSLITVFWTAIPPRSWFHPFSKRIFQLDTRNNFVIYPGVIKNTIVLIHFAQLIRVLFV